MNVGHQFVCLLLCVCLGGEDIQLEGLHWPWRVSGEVEDTFTTRKREQALDAGGEADGGEDEVRGTDAIMEDS